MSNGVIYYNRGTACLARLVISIRSLREHYSGDICLITAGEESYSYIYRIAKHFGLSVREFESQVLPGKGQIFLETTLAANYTPFDTTVWIDSDTVVTGSIDELFDLAEENEVAMPQFAYWTMAKGIIRKRIGKWENIFPERVKKFVGREDLQSLNCGVYGFVKKSKFMRDWYNFALPGRKRFIPNEVAMQLSIWDYPHIIVDQKFNCSCKYSKLDSDTRVIHYHGKKHCRMKDGKPRYNAEHWLKLFSICLKGTFKDVGLDVLNVYYGDKCFGKNKREALQWISQLPQQ